MTTNGTNKPALTKRQEAAEAIRSYFAARSELLRCAERLRDAKGELAQAAQSLVNAVPQGRFHIDRWVAKEDSDVVLFIDVVEDTPEAAISVQMLDDYEALIAADKVAASEQEFIAQGAEQREET